VVQSQLPTRWRIAALGLAGQGVSRVALTVGALLIVLMGRSSAEDGTVPSTSTVSYEGRTLDEWRDVMKSLAPRSPDAAAAVPGLLAIVEDSAAPWFTRRQAALTLGRIGPASASAVPNITRLAAEPIVNGDATTPLWAARALALWGPVAAPATPVLIGLASNPRTDSDLRLVAIEALARIGIAHPHSLPAIVAILSQHPPRRDLATLRTPQELDLVSACVECLDLYGGEAVAAVPVLLRYADDRDDRVRRATAVTLGRIGPRADQAASRLAELVLADPSEDVRDVAAIALGQVAGINLLARLLAHPQVSTRVRAAHGLGFAPPDVATRAALDTARADGDGRVRIVAVESTHKLFNQPQLTAPAAARELTALDRDTRLRAVRFLLKLGPPRGVGDLPHRDAHRTRRPPSPPVRPQNSGGNPLVARSLRD
jgi:HEAT repeat protein